VDSSESLYQRAGWRLQMDENIGTGKSGERKYAW